MHALIQKEKDRGSEKWRFTVIKSNHNHFSITEPGSHAAIRNMYKNNKFKTRIAAYQAAGMHARQTYIIYEIKGPKTIITMRDLYNER
jgi:hypothetical protein